MYVDTGSPGPTHDGKSWNTAFTNLWDATYDSPAGTEIWVAQGNYNTEYILRPMELYGGFVGARTGGYETSRGQRNSATHHTTITVYDGEPVVISARARLDGFTVTKAGVSSESMVQCTKTSGGTVIANNKFTMGGSALSCDHCDVLIYGNTFSGCSGVRGVGLLALSSTVRLWGNQFTNNSATGSGGAVYAEDSTIEAIDNVVANNQAKASGGGFYLLNTAAVLRGNGIRANRASGNGGGVYSGAGTYDPTGHSLVLVGNQVRDNQTAGYGGGVYSDLSVLAAADNLVVGNMGTYGGGIAITDGARPVLVNNTFASDSAAHGWALACLPSVGATDRGITVTNDILWCGVDSVYADASAVVAIDHSDVYGGWPGEGNTQLDPLFVNSGGQDFHLQATSPCVDTGTNSAAELPATDYAGDVRVQDGNGDGSAVVDMGAYEYAGTGVVTAHILVPPADEATIEHTAVLFHGEAHHTGGQAIVDYLWSFGAGSGVPDMHVQDPGEVVFARPGVYDVTFNAQAADGTWCLNPDHRTITVNSVFPDAVIVKPTGNVTIDEHESVEFSGWVADLGGTIVDYLWTFGVGSGIPASCSLTRRAHSR